MFAISWLLSESTERSTKPTRGGRQCRMRRRNKPSDERAGSLAPGAVDWLELGQAKGRLHATHISAFNAANVVAAMINALASTLARASEPFLLSQSNDGSGPTLN